MTTRQHGPNHGRIARAADLVATLAEQLPLTHPARGTVRELQKLFAPRSRIIELLERVPGKTIAQKGERIGVSKQALWSICRGLYKPSADVMARIEAAARETVDGK